MEESQEPSHPNKLLENSGEDRSDTFVLAHCKAGKPIDIYMNLFKKRILYLTDENTLLSHNPFLSE